MNVIVLHYGMGKSGSYLINCIQQSHENESLDVVRLEPLEKHGFYGWLVRSFVPGFKVRVKPVDLRGYSLVYLLVPKWGYNCPPVNGFIDSQDLKGVKLALIITHTKGDISGYSMRLVKKIRAKSADVLGHLTLKKDEILSDGFDKRMRAFCESVAEKSVETSPRQDHEHEIVFIGMVNVNRDDYLQGVVDVWRCRQCKKLFCEDRRYGEPLAQTLGFDEIPEDEEWAILTCTDIKGVFMMSIAVKPGKRIAHTCKNGEASEFVVNDDSSIDSSNGKNIHRLYLVKNHVNKVIEAGYYKLKML